MIRFYFALFASKTALFLMKLIGKKASYAPGLIATKICPEFLKYVGKSENIYGVTGTNGKTTISNLVKDTLIEYGYTCINNGFGSNTKEGVSTLFLSSVTLSNKPKYDYVMVEIDEVASVDILKYIKPKILVITNLFRDSSQRNGHPGFVKDLLESAISNDIKLIVNSEDSMTNNISPENKRVYYSVLRQEDEEDNIESLITDIPPCPQCGSDLVMDFIRYHHIGYYHCPNCDYKRPDAKYSVTKVDRDKNRAKINVDGKDYDFKMFGDNIINIYNLVALVTLFGEMGFDIDELSKKLENVNIIVSRLFDDEYKGIRISLMLAKGRNPIATSRNLDYIRRQKGRHALILINTSTGKFADKPSDSFNNKITENTNWLYENDYEYLQDPSFVQIIAGGKRYLDQMLRVLFAGVDRDKITVFRNPYDCYKAVKLEEIDNIFILHQLYNPAFAQSLKESLIKRIEEEL